MKINKFLKEEYLVTGKTYDNYIFENCPNEFLDLAKEMLVKSNNNVKSCVVSLDGQTEKFIEQTLNNFNDDIQKKVLARDIITAFIVKELLKHHTDKEDIKNFVNAQITAFLHNDIASVRKMHANSFMPHDIKKLAKDIGKIELSFILYGTKNKLLQQSINIFVSSREPYSVKIFTNNEKLPTYYDLNGNLIECPHDFLKRDVNQFIEENDTEKE